MKRVFWFLGLGVALYLALIAYFYMGQRNYLYIPDTSPMPTGFAEQNGVEILSISVEGVGELSSVYRAPEQGRPVILYFHGNGNNVYWRTDAFDHFKAWNVGFLAVEYPGYGGNIGAPNQTDLYKTALANYDYLRALEFAPDEIIIYGHSLGTASATYTANQREASALILSAPFSSALAMGQRMLPFLPVTLLMKDKFRSDRWLADVSEPLLLMHGDIDPVVPQVSGRDLFEHHKGEKEFISLIGGKHDVWNTTMPTYFETWLEGHFPTNTP